MLESRARYVARGISTTPLVVERAEGARIVDVDGVEYVDFALGAMLALELVEDRDSKRPATALAAATVRRARERGLVPLTCGLHGNVIRVLVPLVIDDGDLRRGLDVLQESLEEVTT